MHDPNRSPPPTGATAEEQMRRLTRRSFVTGGIAALAGVGAWRWLTTASPEDELPWPLRRALGFNQALGTSLFSSGRLAPTFPSASVQGPPRTNGLIGLDGDVASATWRLRIQHAGRDGAQSFRLQEVQGLPRMDLVTELKCVEG